MLFAIVLYTVCMCASRHTHTILGLALEHILPQLSLSTVGLSIYVGMGMPLFLNLQDFFIYLFSLWFAVLQYVRRYNVMG